MYGGRERQITWRIKEEYRGGNMLNRGETQIDPRRDPNAMDINKGRGGNRTCYMCRKWGHIATY